MSYRKSIDSSSVVFTQAGAGAVASTVGGKLGETLSVLDFGATGDGVTDDSTAIQSALDALQNGDTLLFPDGLYLLGTGLTLENGGITLKGSNATGGPISPDYGKGPILIANTTGLDILTLSAYTGTYTSIYTSTIGTSPSQSLNSSNVTIDGLQFVAANGVHTGTAIDGILSASLTVRNCSFRILNLCIRAGQNFNAEVGTTLIENNSFVDCSTGSDVVVTVGANPCLITGNTFQSSTGTDIGRGTVDPDNVIISGNIFNNEGTTAAISTSGSGSGGKWVIANNTFVNNLSTFVGTIDIIGISTWVISSNTFTNAFVIDVASDAFDGLISGNFMVNTNTSASADAIRCNGTRVSIINNHIKTHTGTDLIKLEASSTLCVVDGNVLLDSAGALVDIATGVEDLGTTNELADLTVRGGLAVDGAITANGGDLVNTMGVTTIGTTGSITTEDLVNATTGGITLTLPAAATAGAGKVVHIKDRDGSATANNITIEGDEAETIDGSLTFVITVDFQSVTLVSDGSNWSII